MDNSFNEKPIGAWVREADDTFSRLVRKTLNYGVFNRIDWQLLNFIHEKETVAQEDIHELLLFFTTRKDIDKVIKRFEKEGLTMRTGSQISITKKGEAAYHEALTIQEEIKRKAMIGVSAEQYNTTIKTLKAVMDNLKDYVS